MSSGMRNSVTLSVTVPVPELLTIKAVRSFQTPRNAKPAIHCQFPEDTNSHALNNFFICSEVKGDKLILLT